MSVCMHIHTYVHTHTHTHTHTDRHTHTHTQIHTSYMYMYVYLYIHIYRYRYIHIYRAEMVCGGVLSIHTLREVLAPVQLVCDTVRRAVVQDIYGISLPRSLRRAHAHREPRPPLSALDHMREARIKMLRSAVLQAEGGREDGGVGDGLVLAGNVQSRTDGAQYSAEQLLDAFCMQRGFVQQHSGLPDYNRGARRILCDYLSGKLPHWALPP